MDVILPDKLVEILGVSITFSIIIMGFIQNIKKTNILKSSFQIWFLNFCLSFLLAVPFAYTFYNLSYKDGIWVGFFSLMGSSTIYDFIKKQGKSITTLKSEQKSNIIEKE